MKDKIKALAKRITVFLGSVESLFAHTLIFGLCFLGVFFGVPMDRILLIVTTAVSLEAIYLAIFLQLTINDIQSQDTAQDELQEKLQELEELHHAKEEQFAEKILDRLDDMEEEIDDIEAKVDK